MAYAAQFRPDGVLVGLWQGATIPLSTSEIAVVEITGALHAQLRSEPRLPPWRITSAPSGDPVADSARVARSPETRPRLRVQYRIDGGAIATASGGLIEIDNDSLLEIRLQLIGAAGNVVNFTGARRVTIDGRKVGVRLSKGSSQTFRIRELGGRTLTLATTDEYIIENSPVVFAIYDIDLI